MRAGGINWIAVLVAAVAYYVIGGLIYGLIVPEDTQMALTGMTEADKAVAETRMMFGVLMPIATAAFMAVLFKWAQVAGASKGAQWGLLIALASAVPTVWYGWVYGAMPAEMSLIDSAHLLLGHVTVGAILGAWK